MDFSRKNFILGSAAATLSMTSLMRAFRAEAASSETICIAIGLYGANDALNTVVPLNQYGLYQDARTEIAVSTASIDLAKTAFGVTPTSKDTSYAFNPNMQGFANLYKSGKMAVILGAGTPDAQISNQDHEVGQRCGENGLLNGQTTSLGSYGWLGRVSGHLNWSAAEPMPPIISFSGENLIVQGPGNSGLVLPVPLESFEITTNAGQALNTQMLTGLGTISTGVSVSSKPGKLNAMNADFTTSNIAAVANYAQGQSAASYDSFAAAATGTFIQPKSFTNNLSGRLKQIARLITAGSPSRAYFVNTGGFDTHADQLTMHPYLVGMLSAAITQFYAYLQSTGYSKNVIIMTYSDFGRTVQMNSAQGTDHGRGGVNFVIGDSVKGGVYGEYGSLKTPALNSLPVTVDFRDPLYEIIAKIGVDPTQVLQPGFTHKPLGIFS